MNTPGKLWKVDHEKSETRLVDAEPWPGSDSEGDRVFDNTHFKTRSEALHALERGSLAGLWLAGRNVERCEAELREANRLAGQEAVRHVAVTNHVRIATQEIEDKFRRAGPSQGVHHG